MEDHLNEESRRIVDLWRKLPRDDRFQVLTEIYNDAYESTVDNPVEDGIVAHLEESIEGLQQEIDTLQEALHGLAFEANGSLKPALVPKIHRVALVKLWKDINQYASSELLDRHVRELVEAALDTEAVVSKEEFLIDESIAGKEPDWDFLQMLVECKKSSQKKSPKHSAELNKKN